MDGLWKRLMCSQGLMFGLGILAVSLPLPLRAQESLAAKPLAPVPEAGAAKFSAPAIPSNSADAVQDLVTSIILANIPHEYINNKQWGQTKQVFSGLHVERDGLKIETRRRTRPVNHGTWKRYEVRLVNPAEKLSLEIDNLTETPDGLRFELKALADLRVFGRLAQWERGVQLVSLSADADASVRLRLGCQLGLQVEAVRFPPDLILRPVITDANLELIRFRLHRLSELHGPLAKHLGEGLREVLEDKVAEQNDKLVGKLNRQIEKKKDSLRLSLPDLLTSKFGDWSKYLPAPAASPEEK